MAINIAKKIASAIYQILMYNISKKKFKKNFNSFKKLLTHSKIFL